MKKFKKLLAMLLCVSLIMGMLSACKKSEEGKDDATTDEAATTAPTEAADKTAEIDYSTPADYTYWLYSTTGDYSNNGVVKYLDKKFNMTLTFQQPSSGTETDSLNLMLGTGEYTDAIDTSYYTGSLSQLFEEGVIIDIAKYLDYMPNFKALLESDEVFRKNTYNDDGQILRLPNLLSDEQIQWGGMVYRKDILQTMTGNNIQFPSGKDTPTTIADWEYMLPLMKQYFEGAGMADYAPLIIPAKGYFDTGEMLTGFGAAPSYYVDGDTVKYGPAQDSFYNYLVKMNEWYQKGYIYKDFASRTNDLFYVPNTSLTYGGAAGAWFGLSSQLGTVMSMPDYGLNVEVEAVKDPLDADHGVTTGANFSYGFKNDMPGGVMITSACENVERLLASFDYLYSKEGSILKGYGLTKDMGAADVAQYVENGLQDGVYSVEEDGSFKFNKVLTLGGGTLAPTDFIDVRLPGLRDIKITNEISREEEKAGSAVWTAYVSKDNVIKKMPAIIRTVDEESTYSTNQSAIDDYVNTMVLKFILGEEKLDESTWSKFKAQLESAGLNENVAVQQAAYDRYLKR